MIKHLCRRFYFGCAMSLAVARSSFGDNGGGDDGARQR